MQVADSQNEPHIMELTALEGSGVAGRRFS